MFFFETIDRHMMESGSIQAVDDVFYLIVSLLLLLNWCYYCCGCNCWWCCCRRRRMCCCCIVVVGVATDTVVDGDDANAVVVNDPRNSSPCQDIIHFPKQNIGILQMLWVINNKLLSVESRQIHQELCKMFQEFFTKNCQAKPNTSSMFSIQMKSHYT